MRRLLSRLNGAMLRLTGYGAASNARDQVDHAIDCVASVDAQLRQVGGSIPPRAA